MSKWQVIWSDNLASGILLLCEYCKERSNSAGFGIYGPSIFSNEIRPIWQDSYFSNRISNHWALELRQWEDFTSSLEQFLFRSSFSVYYSLLPLFSLVDILSSSFRKFYLFMPYSSNVINTRLKDIFGCTRTQAFFSYILLNVKPTFLTKIEILYLFVFVTTINLLEYALWKEAQARSIETTSLRFSVSK